MEDAQRDIIIFTGQSGIKIDRCIGRLANNGLQFQVLAIDKLMSQVSGQKFVDVLGMPPRIQESLWTQAFQRMLEKLPAKSKKDNYVFLTFHACYFHQKLTEFISPINLNALLQLMNRVKMVIVFIDDCYDIYRRLIDNDQMYEDIFKLEPLDALMQSITNLSNLLTWREIEIAFSRKVAQLLSVPIYCISVKHPTFMVSRLISKARSELNILYLSHPISSIRKQGIYERLSDFYSELNAFILEVLKHENMILFIPDTIDEYRIKEDSINGKIIYVPEVFLGWPLPFSDQWLCGSLPQKLQGINPLNPKNFPFSTADGSTKSAISSSLEMFISRIVDQINARDRTLVEQSVNGILVFRPYWASTVPSGVEQEMQYNSDLKNRYGEDHRKAYLLSASQDLGKWRISNLFTLVKDSAILDAKYNEDLKLLEQKWLEDQGKISEFSSISYDKDLIRKEIESILPGNYEFEKRLTGIFKGTLSYGKMLQKSELLNKGWEEIFKQVNVDDPLLRYSDQESALLCDQGSFGEEAKIFIQNIVGGRN
ncbi:MAG: hypothetical protein ACTSW1_13265 [Candidatus Hodarchaeales archaeon]